MRSLFEVLQLATKYLEEKEIRNAKRQAEEVIADALNISRMGIYLDPQRPLITEEVNACRERISRRAKGEPIAYLSGSVEFAACHINVNKNVLIPRQETEILVGQVIEELEKEDLTGKVLWDLCCGSGCMGIALKKRFPKLKVVLSDISSEALEVAKKNIVHNKLEVSTVQGDMFAPFIGKKADYILFNPPYLAESEFHYLEPEVRFFEPYKALVAGCTGLEFFEKCASQIKQFLNPCGKIWCEMGATQGSSVMDIFKNTEWNSMEVKQDWSGHDRFFFLESE